MFLLNVVQLEGGLGLLSLKKRLATNLQDSLVSILPQLSVESQIFHPTWVRQNGTLYQNNNAYLVTGSDGLDPIFSRLR